MLEKLLRAKYPDLSTDKYLDVIFDEPTLDSVMAPAAKIAIDYWIEKDGEGAAKGTKWDFMTVGRMLKSFAYAFNWWKKEKLARRYIVLFTEQIFQLKMPDGSITGGKIDQIVRWNGRPWIRDFKTTSKLDAFYSRTLEPNDQFSRYTWAGSQLAGAEVQGVIVEVLYNNKKDGPEIRPLTTSQTKNQLDNWEAENSVWTKRIVESRETGIYPSNEKPCKYCKFHSVCQMPNEPAMVRHLKANYRIEPWDFTKATDYD
jgi:hypothetical protein